MYSKGEQHQQNPDRKRRSITVNAKPVLPFENGKKLGPNHTHKGYYHSEEGTWPLNNEENEMRTRVLNLWKQYSEQNPNIIKFIKNKGYTKIDELKKMLSKK